MDVNVKDIKARTALAFTKIADSLIESKTISRHDAYFQMVTLPTKFLKHICQKFDQDIWQHVAIPEKQIPQAFMTVKAIAEREVSTAASALKTASYIFNPALAHAKDQLLDNNEQKAAKFIAKNGTQISLSIFEELYRRGVSFEELKEAIVEFHFDKLELDRNDKKAIEFYENDVDFVILKNDSKDLASKALKETTEKAKDLSKKGKEMFSSFFS
ncbi:hypothetical protein [Thalassotalea sp. PS06]|uniref:hypothetical protein n=1 Tax=Thalassotalea sp. PS06 TaxID=2594005 RepID=UPI0011657046|nr:hypothetical protein [Thalassotalea sp. PS06]QDP02187.1 hypothetical protein FNC98_13060 [Thalassotalea sp. PS06]